MNILITGAAGFIGSNLATWILDNTTHRVVGIDNFSGGSLDNVDSRLLMYKMDAGDKDLDKVFKEQSIDVVYHLAAYASEGRSNYIRTFINQNNTLSTLNIINLCVNNKAKLVFTSSVAVYSGTPPFTEFRTPNPIDEYGLSKYSSELSIKIAAETQGLKYCIIRPRNVYGPKQNLFDPTRNLMGIMCYNRLNNLPITVFGDGTNKRSFTYIDDILEPLYNAHTVDNEIINLGSKKVYDINYAVERFCSITDYNNVVHTEPRHEVKEAYCSITKSERLLCYRHRTGLQYGLYKMWLWAKEQSMRSLITPPTLEVSINLHSSIK